MSNPLDALRRAKVERGWDWTLHSSYCSTLDVFILQIRPPGVSAGKRIPFAGTLENVLGSLQDNGTVDELLKGRLEDVRDTLQEILSQAGEQTGEVTSRALPEGPTAGAPPEG